jgi:tRNA(Phe) wybutosine-synthesizing methylase Tyw3
MATIKKTETLGDNLKQLAEISAWFNEQKEIDVELGLEKVKIAAQLLKSSKEKLDTLENEFKEIEKEFFPEQNNSAEF